jgi:hypothetical protein
MVIGVRHAAATTGCTLHAITEAGNHVRPAVGGRVAQRDQKAARVRLIVAVVPSAPGVDVDGAVRPDGDVAGVPDAVREDRGAEAVGQREAAVVAAAAGRARRRSFSAGAVRRSGPEGSSRAIIAARTAAGQQKADGQQNTDKQHPARGVRR